MKIISSKPISLPEVKSILESRVKEGELEYEQQSTLEYAEKFSKYSEKKSRELVKSLMEKYPSIPEELAIKIVDISPSNVDLLKTMLLKDKVELEEEELKDIVKIFSK